MAQPQIGLFDRDNDNYYHGIDLNHCQKTQALTLPCVCHPCSPLLVSLPADSDYSAKKGWSLFPHIRWLYHICSCSCLGWIKSLYFHYSFKQDFQCVHKHCCKVWSLLIPFLCLLQIYLSKQMLSSRYEPFLHMSVSIEPQYTFLSQHNKGIPFQRAKNSNYIQVWIQRLEGLWRFRNVVGDQKLVGGTKCCSMTVILMIIIMPTTSEAPPRSLQHDATFPSPTPRWSAHWKWK